MDFYDEMRLLADDMFTEFGDSFILQKQDGIQKFNPRTKKMEAVFKEYPGKCVMKPYTAEMIGTLSNIIKAGDVEFKCTMDDISIIPTEGKDKIIFNGVVYNILPVSTVDPSGKKIIVHTLSARRASK